MPQAKIAFREVGKGPVLILLHGYAGSVLHWDQVVQSLKSKNRLVIPNLSHLFMGKNPFTFSDQIEMFAGFIKENFPDQKVNLAGISYGGALVWGVALKHPELINQTVFINPMPPAPSDLFNVPVLKSFFRLPLNMRAIYMILRTPMGRFFLKRAAEVFRLERAEHWERIHDLHGRKLLFVCHVIHNFAFILKNENWNAWKMRLESWTHPSLLIYDHEDPLFQPKTYHRFQDLIGCDITQEIHQAGHIAIQTKPQEIADLIENFLNVKGSTTAA
ncbi:MAG: alpha/beta fold hydrolase [Pseudobdellovibrionaceae bacterium]